MREEWPTFSVSWSHQNFITLRQQHPAVESKLQTCAAQAILSAPAPHTPPKPTLPVQHASKAPAIETIAARGRYLLECCAVLRVAANTRLVSEVIPSWKMIDDFLIAASFHAEAIGMPRYANDGRDARVYPYFDRIEPGSHKAHLPPKAELDTCMTFQPWVRASFSLGSAHLKREKGIGLNFGDDKQAQLRYDLGLQLAPTTSPKK